MTLTRHLWRALLLVSAVIALAPGPVRAYAFSAEGTWTTNDGQLTGTWQAGFDTAGRDVGGVISVAGLPGVRMGNVWGSRDGDNVDLVLIHDGREAAAFQGKVSGSNLTGTFTTPDGVAGQWTGSYLRSSGVAP